jgi:hypothetical protein
MWGVLSPTYFLGVDMNYGELKEQIRDLGFAEDEEINEFEDIIPNSINRAITEINLNVSPIVGTYIIEQENMNGIIYYDIEELTRENDRNVFLEFADTPVMIGDGIYEKYNNFDIENGKILVMDGSVAGKFKVFYKKAHTPFTIETPDEREIPLPLKVHYLLPLLSSYYIWLEDEKAKAVDYYNQYDKLVQEMVTKKQLPRAKILSGGI